MLGNCCGIEEHHVRLHHITPSLIIVLQHHAPKGFFFSILNHYHVIDLCSERITEGCNMQRSPVTKSVSCLL